MCFSFEKYLREYPKLIPIFTTIPTYNSLPSAPIGFDLGDTGVSIFKSDSRLTLECPFITWTGPELGSTQISELEVPGYEAVFMKLPNYIYTINWEITGNIINLPQLWTIDAEQNLAFRVFTIEGKPAKFITNSGSLEIYGFNQFLILESLDKLEITMTITASQELTPETNPWSEGKHYIIKNGCKILAYNNIYSEETNIITRKVCCKFNKFNCILREKYFSDFRKGCKNKEINLAEETGKEIIFPIDNAITTAWGKSAVNLSECGVNPIWILFTKGINPSDNLVLANLVSDKEDFFGSYIHVLQGGKVSISALVRLKFTGNVTLSDVYKNSCKGNFILSIINTDTKDSSLLYDYNEAPKGKAIFKGKLNYDPTTKVGNGDTVTWNLNFGPNFPIESKDIINFGEGQYFWIGIWEVPRYRNEEGNVITIESIRGQFNFQYI